MHADPTGATQKKIRVFHVDDNGDARTLLSTVLRFERDLEEAGSSADTHDLVGKLARAEPDVLVIDLLMEGSDTLAAIREARAARPDLRIVVLTGLSDPDHLERARAAGATECALKGIGLDGTLAAIRGSR